MVWNQPLQSTLHTRLALSACANGALAAAAAFFAPPSAPAVSATPPRYSPPATSAPLTALPNTPRFCAPPSTGVSLSPPESSSSLPPPVHVPDDAAPAIGLASRPFLLRYSAPAIYTPSVA